MILINFFIQILRYFNYNYKFRSADEYDTCVSNIMLIVSYSARGFTLRIILTAIKFLIPMLGRVFAWHGTRVTLYFLHYIVINPFIGVVVTRSRRVRFERAIYHYPDNQTPIRRSQCHRTIRSYGGKKGRMIYYFLSASARSINTKPIPFRRYR